MSAVDSQELGETNTLTAEKDRRWEKTIGQCHQNCKGYGTMTGKLHSNDYPCHFRSVGFRSRLELYL